MKNEIEKEDNYLNTSNMSIQEFYTHSLVEELNNKSIYYSDMPKKYR